MQIKITGHKIKITEPLRDYTQEKIGKLEEFFANIQKVEVVLDARSIDDVNQRQVAEIRVWLAGLKFIQATAAGKDMYAAIDVALAEAIRQVERHKEKHSKEKRRKAEKTKQLYRANPLPEPEYSPSLVKLNRFANKPMSFEEAKEELKNLAQDFLAFRNTATNDFNVVYKNKKKYELLQARQNLTPDQAMAELQSKDKKILFFNNQETNLPSIVFRRKSGNFGLIEPEF